MARGRRTKRSQLAGIEVDPQAGDDYECNVFTVVIHKSCKRADIRVARDDIVGDLHLVLRDPAISELLQNLFSQLSEITIRGSVRCVAGARGLKHRSRGNICQALAQILPQISSARSMAVTIEDVTLSASAAEETITIDNPLSHPPIVVDGHASGAAIVNHEHADGGQNVSKEAEEFDRSLQRHISSASARQVCSFINRIDPEKRLRKGETDDDYEVFTKFRADAAALREESNMLEERLIASYAAELERLQNPAVDKLQRLFKHLAGKEFGSLERNKAVAREIQSLLNRCGLRVRCPKEGCGEPAYLRCAAVGGSKHGAFRFEHRIDGRLVYHAVTTKLPRLDVILAPFLLGKRGRPVS